MYALSLLLQTTNSYPISFEMLNVLSRVNIETKCLQCSFKMRLHCVMWMLNYPNIPHKCCYRLQSSLLSSSRWKHSSRRFNHFYFTQQRIIELFCVAVGYIHRTIVNIFHHFSYFSLSFSDYKLHSDTLSLYTDVQSINSITWHIVHKIAFSIHCFRCESLLV